MCEERPEGDSGVSPWEWIIRVPIPDSGPSNWGLGFWLAIGTAMLALFALKEVPWHAYVVLLCIYLLAFRVAYGIRR